MKTPIVSVKLPHRWGKKKHPTRVPSPILTGTGVGHESKAHHSEIFEDWPDLNRLRNVP